MITGTNATNQSSMSNATTTQLASINLSYGVWLIMAQAGIYNAHATSTCAITNKQFCVSSTTSFETLYQNRSIGTNTLAVSAAACEFVHRVATVSSASATYYLLGFCNYSTGTLQTWSGLTNLYAVQIA